ncbi:MAG: DNA polymerase IV [Opitutales bacterium]|nr:DNA polymerase IV [Opitutales bacterium]
MRKIIHIDMDSYFAAIEMRDHPQWRSIPLAVGGIGPRSVISTANYEARKYGVRSALPTTHALKLCPQLLVVPSRFDVYKDCTRRIRAIFHDYTDLVEPMSLDEAYLDVSHVDRYAWDLAKEIRQRIFEETQLTASAGIAPNMMLAKIASDWKKPNGQFAITPEMVDTFIRDLPIRRIPGVGKKGELRLMEEGINTCGDLQLWPKWKLSGLFGKWGEDLFDRCRGVDHREVTPYSPRKSLSNERTYGSDLLSLEACAEELPALFSELLSDLSKQKAAFPIHKAFVKLKFTDFQTTTCECLCRQPELDLYLSLLHKAFDRSLLGVRLLGLGVRFAVPSDKALRQLTFDFDAS